MCKVSFQLARDFACWFSCSYLVTSSKKSTFKGLISKNGHVNRELWGGWHPLCLSDLGTLPHLRWNSLQQLVIRGLTINGLYCLHIAAVTRPSLQAKLKSDENGHACRRHQIQFLVYLFYLFITLFNVGTLK